MPESAAIEFQVLLCTVGGSHQPIVTAIRERRPDFVCFFATGLDPATGRPGSDVQVNGKGSVIRADPSAASPTLPNIPTQCGLPDGSYESCVVPSDDIDAATELMFNKIEELRVRFPKASFSADYTGGTKSMTAALVLAVIERDDIELQLVTGPRSDLVKVRDGTQAAVAANVERIRLRRALHSHLAAWRRYGYGEAADALNSISGARDPLIRAEILIARDISRAFDAWDRFDHGAALGLLELYRPRIGHSFHHELSFLKLLAAGGNPRTEPARLLDLWRNAERRGAQGRYDDAVARAYRLMEWTAHWLLRTRCGIDTADVSPAVAPAEVTLTANRAGRLQAGLDKAWELVAVKLGGAAGGFIETERAQMRDYLKIRNSSILAHGFEPIDGAAWERMRSWMEHSFLPMLRAETRSMRLDFSPPQLPVVPFWTEHSDRISK
jgi:CRISPR-associated protein (TIGR02710 family)